MPSRPASTSRGEPRRLAEHQRLLGIDDDVGSIATGKRADLVDLDQSGDVVAVIAAGELVAGSLD